MSDPETQDPMVAALLRERAGYVNRGMGDRVTQVDEQLALRGHTPAQETAPVSRTAPPKNRRQRPPETT
ncbi:hypothetical protein J7E90_17130 [Streptomyces sp. ISL-111]|uniref:hypothetical protein n=1 Tax=Streptomyces sp. ISL-111 TaxID=2819175 RepID=UPI001BEB05C7|nr:hypothetical protein [Streptomyces sp. ISL-111]MBT2379026.1 hypothetical protein [Streptomyces sp. ISL-111]